MSWVSITDDQLDSQRMSPLLEALRSAALASGQDDPVGVIVGDVVLMIRTAIAAGGVNVDAAAADTIPPSLVRLAGRLVLWEAKGRLELDRAYDESDHRVDLKTLERLRKGDEPVEPPATGEVLEVSSGSGVEVVTRRERVATRANLDGLM